MRSHWISIFYIKRKHILMINSLTLYKLNLCKFTFRYFYLKWQKKIGYFKIVHRSETDYLHRGFPHFVISEFVISAISWFQALISWIPHHFKIFKKKINCNLVSSSWRYTSSNNLKTYSLAHGQSLRSPCLAAPRLQGRRRR